MRSHWTLKYIPVLIEKALTVPLKTKMLSDAFEIQIKTNEITQKYVSYIFSVAIKSAFNIKDWNVFRLKVFKSFTFLQKCNYN